MIKVQTHNLALFLLIFSFLIIEMSFSTFANGNEKQMVIIIDPGHGGKDPGAVSMGVREKDIVLGVGLKLGKLITENFSDVKVIYTRSTDVFVPLIDRSKIANKNKASLFISIHANTCGTPSIRGTETFTLGLHRTSENLDVAKKENSVILLEDNYTQTYEGFDPNSSESYIMFELTQDIYLDQSLSFADDIQRQFQSKSVSPNRGVKQAGFLVLRQSSMPSVLIETGFVSNQQEAKYLNSEEGQRATALSILEAFRKFKNRNSTSTIASGKKENKEVIAEIPAIKRSDNTTKSDLPAMSNDSNLKSVNNLQKENSQTIDSKRTVSDTKSEVKKEQPVASPVETKLSESNNQYYCVQIGANTIPVDPTPSNFKGLRNVNRDKIDKYYRYYVGKESTLENAIVLLNQTKIKFPQAFIVSFIDGKRNIINLENK